LTWFNYKKYIYTHQT